MARWIGFIVWFSLTVLLAAVARTADTGAPAAPGLPGGEKAPGLTQPIPPAPASAAQLSRRNQVRVRVNEAGKNRRDLIEKANPDGSIKK